MLAKPTYWQIRARTPRGRFSEHKNSAKRRGIQFNLTFEQWWNVWEPYWHRRGRRADQFVMSRCGDVGAYEMGNVFIQTMSSNRRQCATGGIEQRGQRYRAKLRGHTLGSFGTKAEARIAIETALGRAQE